MKIKLVFINSHMTNDSGKVIIFTDGACRGNPGKGGWGAPPAPPCGMVWVAGLQGLAQEQDFIRAQEQDMILA